MDSYNLAICFGPTLMPIPDGQDPVACQAHVNEVIKTIIVHNEVIFPSQRELDGPVYEKCMTGGEEYWWVRGNQEPAYVGGVERVCTVIIVNLFKDFINTWQHAKSRHRCFFGLFARQRQPPQWTRNHRWGWQRDRNTHQWWRSVHQMKLPFHKGCLFDCCLSSLCCHSHYRLGFFLFDIMPDVTFCYPPVGYFFFLTCLTVFV